MRATLRKAGVSILKTVLANDHLDRMASEAIAKTEYPLTERIIDNRGIKFYCIGNTAQWRAETLFTKEPETIEWINTFRVGDAFWDIGANVGCYSLYAGSRGCRVYAFEPAAANFFLLQRSIGLNDFHDRVKAFPIAVGPPTVPGGGYGFMELSSVDFGQANHSLSYMPYPNHRQGIYSDHIDSLAQSFGCPDHIKIDVDGIEDGIVNGALKTLPYVKSLQVEGRQRLKINGFKCIFSGNSRMFDGTKYAGILNHQYVRDA